MYLKSVAKYSHPVNIWQKMSNEIQLLAAEQDMKNKNFQEKRNTSPSVCLWHLSWISTRFLALESKSCPHLMNWAGETGFRCSAHTHNTRQVSGAHPQNNHKTRGDWVEEGLVPDTLPPFTLLQCKRLMYLWLASLKSGSSLGRLITTAKTTRLR